MADSPNWKGGEVPSASEWNSWFERKLDADGGLVGGDMSVSGAFSVGAAGGPTARMFLDHSGPTPNITFSSPDTTGTTESDPTWLATGNTVDATSGNTGMGTGITSGSGDSGQLWLVTGDANGTGNTGTINLVTGTAQSGSSGGVLIQSGPATGAGQATGDIVLDASQAAGGATRGQVVVTAMPTVNPHKLGALWADATDGYRVKMSTG